MRSLLPTVIKTVGLYPIYERVNSRRYRFFAERRIRKSEYGRFVSEAIRFIGDLESVPEGFSRKSLTDDYIGALKKHRVNIYEYFYHYEFYRLTDRQRSEFISVSEMQRIYRKLGSPRVRTLFWNKPLFLNTFSEHIHRNWLEVTDSTTVEDLQKILTAHDCIVKPAGSTRGEGVYLVIAREILDYDVFLDKCRAGKALIEERVRACDEIAEFHPESLNTIRVLTFSNEVDAMVLSASLRMGNRGAHLDSAYAGGISANIDIRTGRVDSDGIDLVGNRYSVHPFSGKAIRGFVIPCWNDIIETCKRACHMMGEIRFAGWDVAVLSNGQIEIIEANHAPDIDSRQAPRKIGLKRKIAAIVKEYYGETI